MNRPGPPRLPTPLIAPVLALLAVLCLGLGPAGAQDVDCSALRGEIDAAGSPQDPAQADADLRRQRDEILRTRDTASRTGCGDGFFDDPDSTPCRALARRIGLLQVGLQRLQDRAFRGDPDGDDRRRDLQARFDARCSAARPDSGDAPLAAVPVDPDAPPGPAATPRASRVFCVRHCDGAFYPLAVDVSADRMPDMDRVCQAQCPSAESSAYAGDGGDVSGATATDGSAYSALSTAFAYLKGPSQTCACRAPHQSWAAALAGAESLLHPQKGDVTVTAELAASMARPVSPAQKAVPTAAKPTPASPKRKPKAGPTVPPPLPDSDVMREFRGSDPTL